MDNHPSLIHYYDFESNNVKGTLVRNLATNSFDGSLVNGATITSADGSYKVGQSALNLVSTGVYSTSPYFSITNGVMLGNIGLTFAVWFKAPSSSTRSFARLFEFGNGQDQQCIAICSGYESTNKMSYGAFGNGKNINSDIVASDGTWKHVVWTLGTDLEWKIYINGQLARTDTNSQLPQYIFRSNAWIGKSAWSNDAPYNGQMDEFRIYNTVLDAYDVSVLYSYEVPGINSLASCTSLTSITVPTSVTYIGNYALTKTSLTSLTIPTSVTSIGMKFMAGCNSLTTITAPSLLSLSASLSGCQQLTEDTSYAVSGMKRYTLQTLTSVTVATGTTSIGTAQFYGCPISTITIPTSVTSINAYAFRFSPLSTIVIPTSVTFIGVLAFESYSTLSSVNDITSTSTLTSSFILKNIGSYPSLVSGTGSDVEVRITGTTGGCCNNFNYMFINSAIQKYPSFELSFDLKIASGWGGDFFSVFFGSGNVEFGSDSSIISNNGYRITFRLYDGDSSDRRGIKIQNQYSSTLVTASLPTLSSTYTKVKIKYEQRVTNTWNVYYNNVLVLSYNDPANAEWVASTGTYWGFVSRTGLLLLLLSLSLLLSLLQLSYKKAERHLPDMLSRFRFYLRILLP